MPNCSIIGCGGRPRKKPTEITLHRRNRRRSALKNGDFSRQSFAGEPDQLPRGRAVSRKESGTADEPSPLLKIFPTSKEINGGADSSSNDSPINSQSTNLIEKGNTEDKNEEVEEVDVWSIENHPTDRTDVECAHNLELDELISKLNTAEDDNKKFGVSVLSSSELNSFNCPSNMSEVDSEGGINSGLKKDKAKSSSIEIEETKQTVTPHTMYPLENWQDVFGFRNSVNKNTSSRMSTSEYSSVTETAQSLKLSVPDNSISGETDIDVLSDADSIAVEKYLAPTKVLTSAIDQLISQTEREYISHCLSAIKPSKAFEDSHKEITDISKKGSSIIEKIESSTSLLCENIKFICDDCDVSVKPVHIPVSNSPETNSDTKFEVIRDDISSKSSKANLIPEETTMTFSTNIPRLLSLGETEVLNNYDKNNNIHLDVEINEPDAMNNEKDNISLELDISRNELSENTKTVIVEDVDGNISMTQSFQMDMILEEGEPIPLQTTTYIYETDTGNISLIQIIPATETHTIPETVKITELDEDEDRFATETVISNTILDDEEQSKKKEEDSVNKFFAMLLPELETVKEESNDESEVNDNTAPTEANPVNQTLSNKIKFEIENKPTVQNTSNENMSTTEMRSNSIVIEREKVQLFNEMQYSFKRSEHTFPKPKVVIAYEQNEISMVNALLSGLTTSDNINNLDNSNINNKPEIINNISVPATSISCKHDDKNCRDSCNSLNLNPDKLIVTENGIDGIKSNDVIPTTEKLSNHEVLSECKFNDETKAEPLYEKAENVSSNSGLSEKPDTIDRINKNVNDKTNIRMNTTVSQNILPEVPKLLERVNSKISEALQLSPIQSTSVNQTIPDIPENFKELVSNQTNICTKALKDLQKASEEPADQIIQLENLIKDTQRNLNQLIDHLRQENKSSNDNSNINLAETIPKDVMNETDVKDSKTHCVPPVNLDETTSDETIKTSLVKVTTGYLENTTTNGNIKPSLVKQSTDEKEKEINEKAAKKSFGKPTPGILEKRPCDKTRKTNLFKLNHEDVGKEIGDKASKKRFVKPAIENTEKSARDTTKSSKTSFLKLTHDDVKNKTIDKANKMRFGKPAQENIMKKASDNISKKSFVKPTPQHIEDKTSKNCLVKPIPEEIRLLQKVLLEKSSFKKMIPEDNSHLRDMIVYQTTTNTSAMRSDKIETTVASISSSATKIGSELRSTSDSSDNVVNADFVTVCHRLPVPSSKLTFSGINRDQFAVLSDAKMEIVDIEYNSSTSNNNSISEISSCRGYAQTDCESGNTTPKDHSDVEISLVQTESAVSEIQKTIEKSILNDLLFMGDESDSNMIEKGVMAVVSNFEENNGNLKQTEKVAESNDALFFITRDSSNSNEEKDDTDENVSKDCPVCDIKAMRCESPPNMQPFVQMKEDYNSTVKDLEDKLLKLNQRHEPIRNRYFEKVISFKECREEKKDNKRLGVSNTKTTKDLLDILTKFTNNDEDVKNPKGVSIPVQANIPVVIHDIDLAPERLVSKPQQQSVNSVQEPIHKISLLRPKQSSVGTDVSSDWITESESGTERIMFTKKASHGTRVRFEDDPFDNMDDYSSKGNVAIVINGPLRKNIFGEPSHATEEHYTKSRVIPTYLKDVSDGIKALMTDLVKPMADVIPFGSAPNYGELRQKSSTNSTEVQANLFTSSQIDLEPSNPYIIVPGKKLKPIIKPYLDGSFESQSSESASLSSYTVSQSATTTSRSFDSEGRRQNCVNCTAPGVIKFDPGNPLRNVLLPPINADPHKYKPHKYDPIPYRGSSLIDFNASEERVTNQYNILHVKPDYIAPSSKSSLNTRDSYSINTTPLLTIDESVETIHETRNDEGINTEIFMVDNKKLLEESSSLTLVNSTLERAVYANKLLEKAAYAQWGTFDNTTDSPKKESSAVNSSFEVIYKQQQQKHDNDNTKIRKTKKNDKRKLSSAVDVTSNKKFKPSSVVSTAASKTSKIGFNNSKSLINPRNRDGDLQNHRSETDAKNSKRDRKNRLGSLNTDNTKIKNRNRKATSNVIVQQCSNTDTGKVDSTVVIDGGKSSSASGSANYYYCSLMKPPSWPSSENSSKDMGDSIDSDMGKDGFPMDWQPELLNELSSKNLVLEGGSSTDVIATIDLLPFMGRKECAWESCNSSEWMFRLLCARVRLIVRLARSNPPGSTSVDTPVSAVVIEPTHLEKNNPVAQLCINFAMEAMRHFSTKECSRAGDIPSLLRRCAAVARIALRWARAMHACWMHLVYNIDSNGLLTLNVANIPLRSVWDVSMNIILVNDEINEVPWPRATDVKVTPVVAGVDVTQQDVEIAIRGISMDWGHAPRTLWRIVRYLQNLRRADSRNDVIMTASS